MLRRKPASLDILYADACKPLHPWEGSCKTNCKFPFEGSLFPGGLVVEGEGRLLNAQLQASPTSLERHMHQWRLKLIAKTFTFRMVIKHVGLCCPPPPREHARGRALHFHTWRDWFRLYIKGFPAKTTRPIRTSAGAARLLSMISWLSSCEE